MSTFIGVGRFTTPVSLRSVHSEKQGFFILLLTPREILLARDSLLRTPQETPRERLLLLTRDSSDGLLARDPSRETPSPQKRLLTRDSIHGTPRNRLLARDSLQGTPCKRLLARDSGKRLHASCKEYLARSLSQDIMTRDGTRTWSQQLLGRPNMPRLNYHTKLWQGMAQELGASNY